MLREEIGGVWWLVTHTANTAQGDQSPGWLPVPSPALFPLCPQGLCKLHGSVDGFGFAPTSCIFSDCLSAMSFVLHIWLIALSWPPARLPSSGGTRSEKAASAAIPWRYLPSQNFRLICLLTFHTDIWRIISRVLMTHMFLKNMWRRKE